MEINGNKIEFSDTPTEPGTYIWNGAYGSLEIIKVKIIPAHDSFGIHWGDYLGVVSHGARHIAKFSGKFCKIEQVEE